MKLHQLIDNCWEFRSNWIDSIRNNPYFTFVDLKWLPNIDINENIKSFFITNRTDAIWITSDEINFYWYMTIKIFPDKTANLNLWNVFTGFENDLQYDLNNEFEIKNLFNDLDRIMEENEKNN